MGWDLTLVAAWLLGAYLRTRRLLVIELEERAASAERHREEQAQTAVLEERARIARELHDMVAHSVSVMVVQAEAAEEMLGRDPGRAAPPLQAIQRTGRETLGEMRRLLGVLHEDNASREPAPGTARLPLLVEGVRASGLAVDLCVRGELGALPTGADHAVYRVVQESLTNVLKHAQASRARVLIDCTVDQLKIELTDDGVGLGGHDAGGGHGLVGMRERVTVLGGRFESGTLEPRGFVVRAWLPVGTRP